MRRLFWAGCGCGCPYVCVGVDKKVRTFPYSKRGKRLGRPWLGGNEKKKEEEGGVGMEGTEGRSLGREGQGLEPQTFADLRPGSIQTSDLQQASKGLSNNSLSCHQGSGSQPSCFFHLSFAVWPFYCPEKALQEPARA